MAQGGGSTNAILIILKEGRLSITPTSILRTECVDPQEAVKLVKQGFRAIIKGSDSAQFHDLWRQSGAAGN